MEITFLSKSPKETRNLARRLIAILKVYRPKTASNGLVLSLEGELGSGKTEFIKGLAEALKIKGKVLSPTFIIMRAFKIPAKQVFDYLYHFDCYRLTSLKDLEPLGFFEIIAHPKNLVVLEWGNKVLKALPKRTLRIIFKIKGKNSNHRLITFKI